MLKAILFDLDGTLLDLDGDAFLEAYIDGLSHELHPWVSEAAFRQALWSAAVAAMTKSHPNSTNQEVLVQSLGEQLDVSPGDLLQRIEHFNHTKVHSVLPGGQPRPGARHAVEAAQSLGLKVAVATTPIYGAPVIQERLRRARLDDIHWDLIATDRFCSTKPHPDFFREVALRLDVAPDDCLMVGDDAFNDLSASNVGMATFYVGRSMGGLQVGDQGTLFDVQRLLQHEDFPRRPYESPPK